MKKMLLIVVAVLVLLCGCDPSSVRVVDTNRFGDYDINVQTALDKQANRLFPSNCPKEAGISNYDYYYQCGIFGDPSFWIVVSFVFNSQMDFDNEKERIQLNASHEVETDDSILLFNTIGNMEYYLDEKVLDGYYFILDMAIIKNRREISYFYVLWQDNAGQNKYIDMITTAKE